MAAREDLGAELNTSYVASEASPASGVKSLAQAGRLPRTPGHGETPPTTADAPLLHRGYVRQRPLGVQLGRICMGSAPSPGHAPELMNRPS